MKKVFASDFDGTLYFHKRETEAERLPEESVQKILEYQKAGHLFGLCTGRQVGGITPFVKGRFTPDFYITASGANIVDGQFREIQKRSIQPDIAEAIIEMVQKKNNPDYRITLDVNGDICVFNKMDYPGKYYVIEKLSDAPSGMIHQVSIHTESVEEAQGFVDTINDKWKSNVQAFRNVVEVDIAPKGCSKGKGVEALKEHMGKCRLYGIGDSMNDLPLIEASDVSYTFPYAPKELQIKATKVVETIVDALDDATRE